jgi:signal transduction histidine kinase
VRVKSRSNAGSVAISVAAVAACAATGALTLAGSASRYDGLEAVTRALTVAVPIAVGLFARHRAPFARFGSLLVAAGFVWFLASLANADSATLYSIGRIAHWLFEPLLLYLLLAFPTGTLEQRLDRAIVWASVLLVAILYLPTAFFVEQFPLPVPVTSCGQGCPANAFMVTGAEPGIIEDLVRPLREILTIALFMLVTGRLAQHLRDATRLRRRALAPVLAVAFVRSAIFAAALFARRMAPGSEVLDVSTWLLALTVPLTAVAFLVGLVRWWVFVARSTQRLAAELRRHHAPEDLRLAFAAAFDDSSLQIVYWLGSSDGQWGDAHGQPVGALSAAPGRAVTTITDGDRPVAAIIHDAALSGDVAFIDSATSYSVMALENQSLAAQTSSLLRSVRESRFRIQAAADDERRRIERDLHDGAQQRLVALRIKLELAAERIDDGRGNGTAGAAALRGLGTEAEAALEEIRSLARGIYPAALADRGLVEGLRAAALRNPLATTVLAAGVRRHSAAIESAAYFCCLEALQNAAKHAEGARAVVIELRDDDSLRMEVRDDGVGFDPRAVDEGLGFVNMRDRLSAVGGELAIRSSPGRGTRVVASIPL